VTFFFLFYMVASLLVSDLGLFFVLIVDVVLFVGLL